jgi:YVTN family beta-propeller protein
VTENGAGTVPELDPHEGTVLRRFPTGLYPDGIAIAPQRRLLLVANSGINTVSLIDLSTGREIDRVPVAREPVCIAVTPDERTAVVANFLPAGSATDPDYAAVLSLIDLDSPYSRRDIRLPAGSTNVHGVAVGPRGRWGYAVHAVARTNVPTTQIESGWIMTSAMSIVDLAAGEVYATVLLDHPLKGAADPWSVAVTSDGSTAWITLSGVHQLARIDLERLHAYLAGGLPEDDPLSETQSYTPGTESIWLRIRRDPAQRADLVNDLAALYAADLITGFDLVARGPRGLALHPDSNHVAIASHFAGDVLLFEPEEGGEVSIALGPRLEPDAVQRGRELFHDATICFQEWLSCASCHPNNGRVDGMNWDNLNDGVGNPKNLKSLVLADQTPPMMWRGVRSDVDIASAKGFHFFGRDPEPGHVEAVQAYVRSLRPKPSPYRSRDGSLSEAAERGRRLFFDAQTGCAECHPAPLWTDLQMHNVGTRGPLDHADDFDTPGLAELYRTGPYLHDGRAADLRAMLTTDNAQDRHGVTSHLTEREIEDLVAFLESM